MSCDGCDGDIQTVLAEMGVPVRSQPKDVTYHRWLRVEPDVAAAIERLNAAWLGTRYMNGQRAAKMGVDCAQLVPGWLDMAYSRAEPTPLPRKTSDAGIHSIRPGMQAIRLLRRNYPCIQIRDQSIEPGDILVMRATMDASGPKRLGHALVAGVAPGTAMHAVRTGGVCMTSIAASTGVLRAYRMLHKETWVNYGV